MNKIVTESTNKPIAVITGAASGLGWEFTKLLLEQDWSVVLIDRDSTSLKTRENQLFKLLLSKESNSSTSNDIASQKFENRVTVIDIDLLDEFAIDKIYQRLLSEKNQIQLLINNAGITHRSLACQTELSVIKKVMDLDFRVPVELTQKLLPIITKKDSTVTGVINIGSMAGWMPVLGRAGYCAAKSALSQYFETLRTEGGFGDHHLLMAYPSFIETNIEQNALGFNGKPATHQRTTVGAIQSARSTANSILTAFAKKQSRLYPSKSTLFASYLYRILPGIFLPLMSRKFSQELDLNRNTFVKSND